MRKTLWKNRRTSVPIRLIKQGDVRGTPITASLLLSKCVLSTCRTKKQMGYFSYNREKQYKDTAFGPQKRFSAQFIIVFLHYKFLVLSPYNRMLFSSQSKETQTEQKQKTKNRKYALHGSIQQHTYLKVKFISTLLLM